MEKFFSEAKASVTGANAQQLQNGVVGSVNGIHGRAIYQPSGKAGEYSTWASNFFNGCTSSCLYCIHNHGITSHVLGGDTVRLKKSLSDENTAYQIFSAELTKWKNRIIADGGLHFTFVSDPCLSETIDLTWRCINLALSQDVPVQVLTKRADWLGHPAVQQALMYKRLIRVGFSLTGCDSLEPGASPNQDRIEAMRVLHNAGISTWASMEPIIDPEKSFEMVQQSLDCCDHYKIGVLSGKKDYSPQQIRDFVDAVVALNPHSVYWKDSLREYVKK